MSTNIHPSEAPWTFEVWTLPLASPPRQELVIRTNGMVIAKVECDFNGGNPYTVEKAQAFANARLMAAAPKLLAALKRLEGCPDLNLEAIEEETSAAMQEARDVIAEVEANP